jgi:UDP-N-acetylmuramyl pentapeptide phosphotransferase/UDP-N-acetylglucosamine-1-phosphate transferase
MGQIVVVLAAILSAFPHIEQLSNPFATPRQTQSGQGSFYLSYLFDHRSLTQDYTPWLTAALGIAFTVFWIVGMMNTFNFLDGLDGLAGGVGAIGALFLGLWSLVMTDVYLAPTHANQNIVLPLILCGAILGFLVFNWSPARVFMGDSGAMFIGFALGALSIFGPVKFGTWLLIMVVPIIDVAWAIVRRLMGRRSFASGDKHHIYHRMLELGLSRQSVVLIFYGLCMVLGVIDLNLYKRQKVVAFVVVAVLSAAGAVLLEVRGRRAESLARTVSKRADVSQG